MRKNNVGRKRLKTISLYSRYEIKGLNLSRLLSSMVKKGIPLYHVKRVASDKIRLSINFNDNEKFFANLNELCYNEKNVRKIRDGGLFSPINFLMKNLGVLIGVIIFFVSTYSLDDLILGTSFSGTGAVLEKEITEILEDYGVKKYARFSSLDLRALEDRLLESTEGISFASLKKEGKVLSVYTVKSKEPKSLLTGKETCLKSTVSGVIEDVKVYRGTAILSIGDKVNIGDTIVDGYVYRNDKVCPINVVAKATILEEITKTYIFDKEGLEDLALTFIEEELEDKNVKSINITVIETDGKYTYTAKAEVKTTLFAG